MKVNAVIANIQAGNHVDPTIVQAAHDKAVDPNKKLIMRLYLGGAQVTPAPLPTPKATVKESAVAPALKYGASPIGRTPVETFHASVLSANLYADAEGNRRYDREGNAYKAGECIEAMGIPTRKNPRSVEAYNALVNA